jgi:hypothetical protein
MAPLSIGVGAAFFKPFTKLGSYGGNTKDNPNQENMVVKLLSTP